MQVLARNLVRRVSRTQVKVMLSIHVFFIICLLLVHYHTQFAMTCTDLMIKDRIFRFAPSAKYKICRDLVDHKVSSFE